MTYASALLVAVLGISGSANAGDRYRSQSNNSQENLRYGLIGNGTGMGTEDATSKGMTDNNTLADPKADKQADGIAETGAPSEPVQSGSTGGSY